MITLEVSEIFNSVQGEGSFVGLPCVFVRLFGCPLGCSFCDTKYAWEKSSREPEILNVDEILQSVNNLSCFSANMKAVIITGGEPFKQARELEVLAAELLRRDYCVAVETSGIYKDEIVGPILEHLRHVGGYRFGINLSPKGKCVSEIYKPYVLDIKQLCGATEEEDPEVPKWIEELRYKHRNFLSWFVDKSIFIQPIAYPDEEKTKKAMERAVLLAENLGCRVCFQTHKYIGLR